MKPLHIFSYITILLALFAVLLSGYWILYPYKTIKFNVTPLPILNENKTVKSGGYLSLSLDYCKYSNITPQVNRTFTDGILYDIPPSIVSSKDIGCSVVVLHVYVPKALPPGNFVLKSVYRYQVNPIRSIDVSVETEPFIILK
jgi:hypothetical protein